MIYEFLAEFFQFGGLLVLQMPYVGLVVSQLFREGLMLFLLFFLY